MTGKKYPDTFSDTAKKRIDFIIEYGEMAAERSLPSPEIDSRLKEKYGMSISDLPRRDTFVREFHGLYTRHCWCETNRMLREKYGMTIAEFVEYYKYYPLCDQFTHKSFDYEYSEIAADARECRLNNLKKPAILEQISEDTSYGEFKQMLSTSRELCDYFHNMDEKRENEFVEIYTTVRGSKTGEAREEARQCWLEYARTDLDEWEYYDKPCGFGNAMYSSSGSSGSGWAEVLVASAEDLHKDNYPLLIAYLDIIIKIWGDCVEAYHRRALAYIKTGDHIHAAEDLRKALELDPNHAGAGKALALLEQSLPSGCCLKTEVLKQL
jgi:tetratricopeptide (TPR) repeat protein